MTPPDRIANGTHSAGSWVTPRSDTWPPGLGALTTTRAAPAGLDPAGRFGWNLANHVEDDPAAVAAGRRMLAAHAGVTGIQWMNQVHGADCFEAGPATVTQQPDVDALWTRTRGLGLAALTADCVPVVMGDRDGSVAAVAHGGWRGLVGGVLETLVRALPVSPRDLVAWLGPAIGPDAYQIGADVVSGIEARPDGGRLLGRVLRPDPAPGHHRLDLFELALTLLEQAGVGQVSSERYCTFADTRFYSFRRDRQTGRMATLAWLR